MAKVQVLIPCYNYGRYLEACVASVLSQQGVDLDILIIDDCSTDDTPEMCRRIAASDKRVRVVRHDVNRGHIATYNEGIAQLDGDYFVLLSADDLLTPGCLSRATALMEANASVGMVYGQPLCFSGDALPAPRTKASGWTIWPGAKWMRLMCRAGKNFVVCPEAVVRTSVQRRIGGYNADLPHSADMEMWLRIAAISDIGRVKGADQAYYRVHAASMQRTVHDGFLFDLLGRRDAFRSAFAKEASGLKHAADARKEAHHALAVTALRHARRLCDGRDDPKNLVGPYQRFALSVDPDIIGTWHWRALDRASRDRRTALGRAAMRNTTRFRALVKRQVLNRLEYYLARHTGIYFLR